MEAEIPAVVLSPDPDKTKQGVEAKLPFQDKELLGGSLPTGLSLKQWLVHKLFSRGTEKAFGSSSLIPCNGLEQEPWNGLASLLV